MLFLHLLLEVAEMTNRIVVNQQDALLSEGFSADFTLVWPAGIVVLVGLSGAGTSLEIISLLSVFSGFVLTGKEKLALTEEEMFSVVSNLPESCPSSSLLAFLMLFSQWDPCISIISLCSPSALME